MIPDIMSDVHLSFIAGGINSQSLEVKQEITGWLFRKVGFGGSMTEIYPKDIQIRVKKTKNTNLNTPIQ